MARLWLVPFLVVLVAGQVAVGMRASRTASVTGDEPFYLLTMQSLASDGDLDLRDEYATGEMDRFWDGTVPLWKQMEPSPDGRLLAPHDPGLPLLALPAYHLGGLRGVQRFLVALWAAAMAVSAVLARRAGAPPAAAVAGPVVVGIGAPGIVYASQVYPEAPAALALAVGLLVATEPDARRPRPLAVAATLVALVWLGVKYAPLAAAVAGVWAWRFRHDRRALAAAAVVVALAAAHSAWWHLRTFGGLTTYSTNVVWAGEGTGSILGRHLQLAGRSYRLYGLFLDARFGLLRWLPVAVVAVWGVCRRTLVHLAALAVCVLVATFASITMMGWWFPGRMLVAALPAVAVLVAVGASRIPWSAAALSLWSVAIAAVLVWAARTERVRLAVDPFILGLPLPPASVFPDFRRFGAREALTSLAWVAGLLALRSARALGRGLPVLTGANAAAGSGRSEVRGT
jgi:hypothetical protein